MTSESETCTSPTEIPAPAIATHLLDWGGGSLPSSSASVPFFVTSFRGFRREAVNYARLNIANIIITIIITFSLSKPTSLSLSQACMQSEDFTRQHSLTPPLPSINSWSCRAMDCDPRLDMAARQNV